MLAALSVTEVANLFGLHLSISLMIKAAPKQRNMTRKACNMLTDFSLHTLWVRRQGCLR